MVHLSSSVALLAPVYSLMHVTLVTGSPFEVPKSSHYNLQRREDEDDTEEDILADKTGPLREAVPARGLYVAQPTATWYQIDVAGSDDKASLTSFATTGPSVTPPKPDDPNQTQNPGSGDEWDVDHILELQILASAFKGSNPPASPAIASSAWTSVSNAVFTKGPACTSIAKKITTLNNLEAIPNRVNGFKKSVVKAALTGGNGPSNKLYFNFFGPAVQKYLNDAKSAIFGTSGVASEIGDALKDASGGDASVSGYFTSFASAQYQSDIDFLSKFSGLPLSRTSSATTTSASTAGAAAASCENAADPHNTCAAVAAANWCDCGDENKYIEQPNGGGCAWTTLPATTSFDCPATAAATPTPTAAPAPTCTLKSQVIGGGRSPEITHTCNCSDGSHPDPTVDKDKHVYVCPNQVAG